MATVDTLSCKITGWRYIRVFQKIILRIRELLNINPGKNSPDVYTLDFLLVLGAFFAVTVYGCLDIASVPEAFDAFCVGKTCILKCLPKYITNNVNTAGLNDSVAGYGIHAETFSV